jgi:hypothetical protein
VTSWFVSLEAVHLPRFTDIADLLASYGVFPSRVTDRTSRDGRDHQSFLVFPAERRRLEDALRAVRNGASCSADAIRALEVPV